MRLPQDTSPNLFVRKMAGSQTHGSLLDQIRQLAPSIQTKLDHFKINYPNDFLQNLVERPRINNDILSALISETTALQSNLNRNVCYNFSKSCLASLVLIGIPTIVGGVVGHAKNLLAEGLGLGFLGGAFVLTVAVLLEKRETWLTNRWFSDLQRQDRSQISILLKDLKQAQQLLKEHQRLNFYGQLLEEDKIPNVSIELTSA